MFWRRKRQKNLVEIESAEIARFARSMELVDLETKFLLLQVDVKKALREAVAKDDFERAEALENALLSLSRAKSELK